MDIYLGLGPEQSSVAADARAAEDAGYDGISWGEHLFFHGPTPNAFVTMAAAAGATTLGQVSNGRFDLGVGVGGEYPAEFDGDFARIPGLALAPQPVQDGGPPIWLGGRCPAALRRAATPRRSGAPSSAGAGSGRTPARAAARWRPGWAGSISRTSRG